MSRIGKRPVPIPQGVQVKMENDVLVVKGPKGELRRKVHPLVKLSINSDKIEVSVENTRKKKEAGALQGLFRVLLDNMVTGVTKGFERNLEIVGVGYRAEVSGDTVVFNLGYSHPINFRLPKGIEAKVDRNKITLSGVDKEILGQTAANIRALRPPEPFKGKGIKYEDEVIRRKAGKAGAK
ncbi:MAG: 50S ribosomal protein L6 [Deltaproteobacteria bacterium]|nr:MAG: 50S ribosomal protein L6 [Deltaproteobacteria bacterium]HDG98907.1 50S ribosomal protein L6 [Desulfobacterales bacterium]